MTVSTRVRLVALLVAASLLGSGPALAATRSDVDPGAGPLCDHLYCLASWGLGQFPKPDVDLVTFTTANDKRNVTTEMSVNWRYFPEAAQTITVTKPVTFDAAHVWNVGVSL